MLGTTPKNQERESVDSSLACESTPNTEESESESKASTLKFKESESKVSALKF